MNRYALRDDQWERIKPLLPGKAGDVGVTASDNRRFVEAVLYRYRAGIPRRAPCSSQGQACMGQLLSSLMVGEVNGRLGWVRAGLTIRGERAIGLQPNTLVFGRPRVGLDHDAAMRIGGEAPGGGPIL